MPQLQVTREVRVVLEAAEARLGQFWILDGIVIQIRPRPETKLVDLAELLLAWPNQILHPRWIWWGVNGLFPGGGKYIMSGNEESFQCHEQIVKR